LGGQSHVCSEGAWPEDPASTEEAAGQRTSTGGPNTTVASTTAELVMPYNARPARVKGMAAAVVSSVRWGDGCKPLRHESRDAPNASTTTSATTSAQAVAWFMWPWYRYAATAKRVKSCSRTSAMAPTAYAYCGWLRLKPGTCPTRWREEGLERNMPRARQIHVHMQPKA
jgi:hypothetical protein